MPKQRKVAKEPQVDFSDDEISRRRDAVINRMANTPPQPKTNGHRPKRKRKVGVDRAADKNHAAHAR